MKKKFALLLSIMLCLFCLPSAAFAAEADEMVPVVVKTPDGWESPCLWAWADDDTNAFAAWPGEELEALEGGWYYTYVPSFVQNVIVSANNDAETPVQTEGIVVEAGKEVFRLSRMNCLGSTSQGGGSGVGAGVGSGVGSRVGSGVGAGVTSILGEQAVQRSKTANKKKIPIRWYNFIMALRPQ